MTFGFSASYVAIWGLVVFQGLLILAVLRQLAELRQFMTHDPLPREDLLPVGSLAPRLTVQDGHSGDDSSFAFDGRGGVILFLSPECTTCKALAKSFQPSAGSDLPFITAICSGETDQCAGFGTWFGPYLQLLLDRTSEIRARYHISGFPTAVIVDKESKIRAYAHPQSFEDIRQLWKESLGEILSEEGPNETLTESREALITSRRSV